MLGKLFNLTTGNAGCAASEQSLKQSPESVQEEIHTRSLLFPDTQALYHRQDQVFPLPAASALPLNLPSHNFDYDGEAELDVRDVRVIIMQDSLGSVNPSLLFDSHPGPSMPSATDKPPVGVSPSQTLIQDLRRNPTSPRRTSLNQSSRPATSQPDSPQHRQGAFDRRSSFQARNYSYVETEAQRDHREYREELASFSTCIFANSEVMSYKGTSTKVHVVPSDPRSAHVSNSYVGDGRGSMGRTSMRSSRLAQSFTSEFAAMPSPSTPKPADRRKILVTRLFPVNLLDDELDTPVTGATSHSRLSEDDAGFPFPASPDESNMKKKKLQPKQKRTPMYAVALVLQLPTYQGGHATPAPKHAFRGSSSFTDRDSFTSFNSARRSGWAMGGSGYGVESFDSSFSNDVEDKLDAITQHWDIVMRTLTHLQSVVATALFPMLKHADFASPDPHPSISAQIARTSSISSRRGSTASQIKPPKTNAKLVTLAPNCLMQDKGIGREIDSARIRIVSGLRATRVVTGQGRWGPWREEARWVAKWAGGKEQGFFFFNLLTGFLATHTDWLQALSPLWYRRRYYELQKAKTEEDTSLFSRTIIVSKDKMAARRLVFLLSAFMPANQQMPTVHAQRPSTSASFSHSPPSLVVPYLREESLRRKINRRPLNPRGASHNRSLSIATTRSVTGIPAQLAHLSMDSSQGRRPSDASLHRSSQLPIPGSDLSTRKSSAATMNAITPETTIPHFSINHEGIEQTHRPGSSGSMAADDLKRALRRGDSTGHMSSGSTHSRNRSSNWGSVISGLWSTRRRGSTATSSRTLDLPGSHGNSLASPTKFPVWKNKLEEMVSEPSIAETPTRSVAGTDKGSVATSTNTPHTPRTIESRSEAQQIGSSGRFPDPSAPLECPVKTSVNNEDGVIDVDVPFPDYLTSIESAISSPSSSGYLSTPGLGSGLDAFEQFSSIAVDGDSPLNVAGWLQQYHPDFSLQAIPPDAGLLDAVKESLKAEPTPSVYPQAVLSEWPTEHWVDVSSAIIADTTTFTIKRLRYSRLVKPKFAGADKTSGYFLSRSANAYSSSLMTPALSPYEQPIKDKIEEETLVTLDEVLIDAVEKVIAQSNDASKGSSANSSRSVSKRRERTNSEISEPDAVEPTQSVRPLHAETQEVPRAECKAVVLTALNGIVQDVLDQRERDGRNQSLGIKYETVREKESALRGAVRAWLENVELGDG